MLIVGFDLASATGWAVYDTSSPLSSIITGTWQLRGDTPEAKAADLGRRMTRLFKKYGPGFVGIELALKRAVEHKKSETRLGGETVVTSTINPQSIITPNQLCGATMGIVGVFGLKYALIDSKTWRKFFLGFGTKPGLKSADWKRLAVAKCDQLRIQADSPDAAEAVGVALTCPSTQEFRKATA